MKLVKAKDLVGTPSGIFYGDNGAGKTHFLGTVIDIPELLPAVIIEGEPEGCETLRHISPELTIGRFDPGPINKQFKAGLAMIKDIKPRFVAFDGVSFAMNKVVYELSGGNRPSFNNWEVLFQTFLSLIDEIKAITPHVFVTALPLWIKNGDGDIVGVQPLLKGQQFPLNFNSIFNILGFMEMEEKKKGPKEVNVSRRLRVMANGFSRVRSRVLLREDIKEPTIPLLYETLAKNEDKSVEEYVLSRWKEGSGQISK